MILLLLSALLLVAALYLVALFRRARASSGSLRPSPEMTGLGAVVQFFDTLGIGCFAPTTAYLKLKRVVPDKIIPATMIVGFSLPTIAQALIFIQIIEVDIALLVSCISAAVAGALVGTRVTDHLPTRHIRLVMGIGLLVAAVIYSLSNLGLMPAGGSARELPAGLLALAVLGHFILGILMTIGIGLYAPALVLLSLMGLDPRAAFPIMMGACAFLMPSGSVKLLRRQDLDLSIILGLALGGIPAVLIAAYLVTSLPLDVLRWGVVVVVCYASFLMLRSVWRREDETPLQADAAPSANVSL